MQRRSKILPVIVPLFVFAAVAVTALTLKCATAKDASEKTAVIERIVAYLKGKEIDMGGDNLKAVVHKVYDESLERDIDYRLALAVIKVESNFKHDAVSKKGARGLFQIKPSLAKYIAKDAGVKWNGAQCLQEPDKNIKLGVYHLSRLVEDFKSLPMALDAYNAGTTKARHEAGKRPSTKYAKRVLKEYKKNISILPEVDGPK